ncbi:hypothetical protein [Paenibacillus gansuensis]|uniref:Uncharacterized protein n=1 Tax=Paenibacillus gansuensis TaxID=306542 RepID=A0ABW5PFW4_9BACL
MENNPLLYIDPTGHSKTVGSSGGGPAAWCNYCIHDDSQRVANVKLDTKQEKAKLLDQLLKKYRKDFFETSYPDPYYMTKSYFKYLYSMATTSNNENKVKWALLKLQNFFIYGKKNKFDTALEGYGLGGSAAVFGTVGKPGTKPSGKRGQGVGSVSKQPVQVIQNRYPNEVQQGKTFEYVLENGQLKIRNGIKEVDFIIDVNVA